MKKIFTKLLVLLVAVASGMALTGCGKDNPQNNEPEIAQDLIGKWKLVSYDVEYKNGNDVEKNTVPLLYSLIWEFTDDGKVIQTMEEEGEIYTTIATYTPENNIITTNDDGAVMQIKELTSKKLVVERRESDIIDGKQYTITGTYTFEKMNGSGGQDPEEQEGPVQVYTVFDAATGVLTYYCDNKMNSREGQFKEIYKAPNVEDGSRECSSETRQYYKDVKKVVVDPSMKEYPYPTMESLFGWDMDVETQTFYGYENMTEIDGLENLPVGKVMSMRLMFAGCSSLKSLDLRSFADIPSATQIGLMFYNCTSLETIYCNDDWSDNKALTYSSLMFKGCEALEGGKGTKYDPSFDDQTYARPDGGPAHPGFFTPVKELNPIAFSVAKANQVFFSKANLQYHPTNEVWRFADAEYDIVGNDNSKIARFCENWIDLFGWGSADEPYNASTYTSEYPSDFTDWGTKNISNGGGMAWRTLTAAEWEYLFEKRANATSLFGFGSVNGTNGLILLPDGWEMVKPENLTFVPAAENGFENKGSYYQSPGDNYGSNTYTLSQWTAMEEAWAVFRPAAGSRFSKNVSEVNQKGYYWSATHAEEDGKAHYIYFRSNGYSVSGATSVSCGYSVRLVRDVE